MLKAGEPIILGFDLSGGVACQQAAAHLTAEQDWDPRLVSFGPFLFSHSY